MKKVNKSVFVVLSVVKLFLNDLEEIDAILKANSSSYKLTLDDYELESINEVREIDEKQDFHELKIQVSDPYISVEINKNGSHIYLLSEDEIMSIGITEKLKKILKNRRNTWKYFYRYTTYFFVIVSILSLELSPVYYENHKIILIGYAFWAFTILWCIVSFIFRNKNNIVFTSKKYHEIDNYFVRNKDQLINSIVSGFIGLLVGITVTWFRCNLTPL